MKSLIASAKRELTNIKKNATVDEIQRLIEHINILDGLYNDKCIYGLMTGNCHTSRASELITECASIYKIKGVDRDGNDEGRFLLPTSRQFVKHRDRKNSATYFSKLELLTMLDKEAVQKLVKQILV